MDHERDCPELVQQWVAFLRTMEAVYAGAGGTEGFTALTADERLAAAQLAASLGLRPGDALGMLATADEPSERPLASVR
jgi:hypothetical protein